tara:strand:- start:559 stop:792 length:234 start_codon:yes stop_codon:yes gene_type:complete
MRRPSISNGKSDFSIGGAWERECRFMICATDGLGVSSSSYDIVDGEMADTGAEKRGTSTGIELTARLLNGSVELTGA